jgi:hypothetical protein
MISTSLSWVWSRARLFDLDSGTSAPASVPESRSNNLALDPDPDYAILLHKWRTRLSLTINREIANAIFEGAI